MGQAVTVLGAALATSAYGYVAIRVLEKLKGNG